MTKPPEEVQRDRPHLRLPVISDTESIYERYAQDEQVTKFVRWSPRSSIDDTREFVRRCITDWEEKSAFPWAIIRLRDNCLPGTVEIHIQGHKADLGYVNPQPDWSKVYTAAEVQTIVKWVIEQPRIMRAGIVRN